MTYELTRRQFLQLSAAAGLAVLATRGVGLSLYFTSEERGTLLEVVRTLFPHQHLDERPYTVAVVAIEDRCREDVAAFKAVAGGIAVLDRWGESRFASASYRQRVRLLRSGQDSPFYRVVYGEALESLYGSPDMWGMFVPRA